MSKKTNLTIFFSLVFSLTFAQQKLKVVRKSDAEKPKVERVDAKQTDVERIQDPTKAQVERIEDAPKTKVDRIEDGPKPKVDQIEDGPKPKVDRIEDGPKPKVDRIGDVDRIQDRPKAKVDRIEDAPKTKVDRLPGESVKPNVPIITDPTPTQVDRIEDGPKPKVERIVDPQKANVDRIEDGVKPNVDRIEDSKRANVDLLEDDGGENPGSSESEVESGSGGPAAANAGKGVFQNLGLKDQFKFNRKIGFYITSTEGDMASHFYLDTHTGASMLDHEGNQAMAAEKLEGEVIQIMTHLGDFLSFTKSSEGNFFFKMGAGSSPVMMSLQDEKMADEFFKFFKPSGNQLSKGQGGHKFNSTEYVGKYEGQSYSLYLADAGQVRLDTKQTQRLTGHFGLGYIAEPNGKTYMLTGFQAEGASIFMTYNESASKTFDGSGYQSLGDLMGKSIDVAKENLAKEREQSQREIEETDDSQLREIRSKGVEASEKMQESMLIGMEEMAKDSDVSKMGNIVGQDFYSSFFETAILKKEEEIRMLEIQISDARERGDAYNLKILSCSKVCRSSDWTKIANLKMELESIQKKYPEEDPKREELSNALLIRFTQNLSPCECN